MRERFVHLLRAVEDAALFELLAVAAERRRVEHIRAARHILALNFKDALGMLEHPLLGAHVAGEAALLELGAGRAVQNHGKLHFHRVFLH